MPEPTLAGCPLPTLPEIAETGRTGLVSARQLAVDDLLATPADGQYDFVRSRIVNLPRGAAIGHSTPGDPPMPLRPQRARPRRLDPADRPTRAMEGGQRPYVVWSFDYSHATAGQKALHRLCHELNRAGQQAYIGNRYAVNPEWDTPHADVPLEGGDWVAVYPEVVPGNPWRAPHVARWVLYFPGVLAGDREYDRSEAVFAWDREYLDGVPVLQVPTVDLEIYRDLGTPREGALTFANKGRSDLLHVTGAAAPITLALRLDPRALAAALNHAEVLYTTDAHTGMTQLALLCGCPVVIVPTGERMEPAGYRDQVIAQAAAFPAQLATFVEITQGAAVPA